MLEDTYITLKEASSLLGVTSTTLRNWDKKGKLKAVRNPVNNYRLYRLSGVVALQNESSLFQVKDVLEKVTNNKSLSTGELRRLVRALHRILRDCEGNSNLIERFDELTKILYCKIEDEKTAMAGSKTSFCIRNGEGKVDVAQRIRLAFSQFVHQQNDLFPARFTSLKLGDNTIFKLTQALAPVRISFSRDDLKGLAYEEVIKNTFDKGDNQQFFTPTPIVEFMVGMVRNWLTGIVCDPACGTGGFLLSAFRTAATLNKASKMKLWGFEVDERLAWVTRTNLHLHDVKDFSVIHFPSTGSLGKDIKKHFGVITTIITNPPFGSDFTDSEALSEFELGKERASRRRGVLFLERSLGLLKPGGVVAIIIDDSVLNGHSNADTRRLILERSEPFAIVSLPDTAFMPYASVKSSILFLQKRGGRQERLLVNGKTLFAEATVVGRKPNGDPLFRLNRATRRLELDSDLPDIQRDWELSRSGQQVERTENGRRVFWAPLPDLEDYDFSKAGFRLDLSYHHPSRFQAARMLANSRYPMRSLGEIADERRETVVPSKGLQEEEINYIGLANIESHSGVCTPTVGSGSSLKSSVNRFIGGDILFSKMRPELRKVCLIPMDIEEGFASSECLVISPKMDSEAGGTIILPELLELLLRSDLAYGQLVHLVTGIGRPRISRSAILNLKLPLPPIDEQKRLLELYGRSQEAANVLFEEGQATIEKSKTIIQNARRQLIQDLLSIEATSQNENSRGSK